MAERSEHIAATIERENQSMVAQLGELTINDLATPCPDDGGETVGAIVAHLAEGYAQILDWLERTVPGLPPRPSPAAGPADLAVPTGPAGPTGPARLDAHADRLVLLRDDGAEWTKLVTGLSDDQLDLVPLAATGFTDGTLTLAAIIEGLLDHQRAHLGYIDRAVAGTRAGRVT